MGQYIVRIFDFISKKYNVNEESEKVRLKAERWEPRKLLMF